MVNKLSLAARADAANQALFTRYDRLNELWQYVEKRLTAHHVPDTVRYVCWKEYQDEDAELQGYGTYYMLGLVRIKGEWRVCHGVDYDRSQDEVDWFPIIECSASTRAKLAKYLPGFEEKVVENAEGFVAKVDESIKFLEAFLASGLEDAPSSMESLLTERAKLNGRKRK